MPIKRIKQDGKTMYRFGKSGKAYPTRAQALRQARAIFASGYKKKK